MNIYIIMQVIEYKEFDVIRIYLNHLQFSNIQTDRTVYFKKKRLNENFT